MNVSSIFFAVVSILFFSCSRKTQSTESIHTKVNQWKWLPKKITDTILFAPGVVSVEGRNEMSLTFSPDGDTCFFCILKGRVNGRNQWVVMQSVFNGGKWNKPDTCTFSRGFSDYGPFYSPREHTIYFSSRRPAGDTGTMQQDYDLWKVKRDGFGWMKPIRLADGINTKMEEFTVACSNKNLFICATRNDRMGGTDLFGVSVKDELNAYAYIGNLGKPLNDEMWQGNPYVTPDENMIVFNYISDDTTTSEDIYYSIKQHGNWIKPKPFDASINTGKNEFAYCLSPDKKILFFGRNGDIYMAWVNTYFDNK